MIILGLFPWAAICKTFSPLLDLTSTSAPQSINDLTIKILPRYAAYKIAVLPNISVLFIYEISLPWLNFFLNIWITFL